MSITKSKVGKAKFDFQSRFLCNSIHLLKVTMTSNLIAYKNIAKENGEGIQINKWVNKKYVH